MWRTWILLLSATGISLANYADVQTNSISLPSPSDQGKDVKEFDGIRRFACPVGFFRLKRNCYYLSAGVAQWRDAYYHCRDRNASLAVLDKNGKDRLLRKYLMGDQFTKLERWIGGVYNWRQMSWKWGETGDKIEYENFATLKDSEFKKKEEKSQEYAWHCIVLDPAVKYKWNPRSCIQQKHYICEVPAGRIGRRRKKTIDPGMEPQSQKLKTKKKGNKKYRKQSGSVKDHHQNDVKSNWRRKFNGNVNEEWAHGVKMGSHPLAQKKSLPETRHANRTRHRPNRRGQNKSLKATPPQTAMNYGAFLGDGPENGHRQQLSDDDNALQQFQANINDFTREEVLLKT